MDTFGRAYTILIKGATSILHCIKVCVCSCAHFRSSFIVHFYIQYLYTHTRVQYLEFPMQSLCYGTVFSTPSKAHNTCLFALYAFVLPCHRSSIRSLTLYYCTCTCIYYSYLKNLSVYKCICMIPLVTIENI